MIEEMAKKSAPMDIRR